MTFVQTALTHIRSQVFEKWLPPPVLQEGNTLRPSMPTPAAWCETDFWADAIAGDTSMTAEQRHRVVSGAAEHFHFLMECGGHYVPFWSSDYPSLLRFTPHPPIALSVLGGTGWLVKPGVAVVGSRKATAFALSEAVALGKELAKHNITVVSGGALGCDIAAHWGALAGASGLLPAVVVFAGGLGSLYPRHNLPIFREILSRGGAMISERLWGAPSRPRDFPTRNRIISGMTPLTVVMQAGARSGAYITARWALDQSREVTVLQHPQGDVRASGSEALIEDGARAFSRPAEVMAMCETIRQIETEL